MQFLYRFIPVIKVRYWEKEEEEEEKEERKGEEKRAQIREKKRKKKVKNPPRVKSKEYMLNRWGGLRPEGGRFFTRGRLVDAACAEKKTGKKIGGLLDGEKTR